MARMPSIFPAHGSPPPLDDAVWMLTLRDYRHRAPSVPIVRPTHEHSAPLLVIMGAAEPGVESISFPITGFAMSTLTKRSVQVG